MTDTKTYICELKGGNTRKITVPAKWKITFGNVVPYQGKGGYNGEHRLALRFYEGAKENLRAVFTDVVAIRDDSIQVIEKRTSVQRKTAKKQTHQGLRDVVVEARVTEWVNPDDEHDGETPGEFLALPAPDDE